MSISELTDLGQPHPWANLRVNDFTVDSNLTANNVNISNLTIGTLDVTGNSTIGGNEVVSGNETVSGTTSTNHLQILTDYSVTGLQSYNIAYSKSGEIRISDTNFHTVYTYFFPPVGTGASTYIQFICTAKGGPVGSTNNFMFQQTSSFASQTNTGTDALHGTISNTFFFSGFSPGNIGQNITLTPPFINFQLYNNQVGQTTDFAWTVYVYSLNTTL